MFLAVNRCSAAIAEDDNENHYEKITTASNAANTYAFAAFDISEYTDGAKLVVLEFDTYMSGDRWYVGISDLTNRPGESYRTTYDTAGVVMSQGTKDGTYYYINNDITWKSNFFNKWVHSKITANLETKKVSYEISNGIVADKLSGTIAFQDTTVEKVTGIEIFSYVNNVEMGIDNIKITANYADKTDERTIYIIPEGTAFAEYIYIDGKPVCLGRSDIVSTLTSLIKRVEALENK
ncbi:MAG: hypothetical protein ACI4DP_02180 [Candidatus Ornithomonoglobus sp.]